MPELDPGKFSNNPKHSFCAPTGLLSTATSRMKPSVCAVASLISSRRTTRTRFMSSSAMSLAPSARESLGEIRVVLPAFGLEVLIGDRAPTGEVRCGAVVLERSAVVIVLVQHEVARVVVVLQDVEHSAAGFVPQRRDRVLRHRVDESVPPFRTHAHRND